MAKCGAWNVISDTSEGSKGVFASKHCTWKSLCCIESLLERLSSQNSCCKDSHLQLHAAAYVQNTFTWDALVVSNCN